jgi:hypothetical protein
MKSIATYWSEVWQIKKKVKKMDLEKDLGVFQQEHLENKRLEMK